MHDALATIRVSSELFHVGPLQAYIRHLAQYCGIPERKFLHIDILIEEVFTHIVSLAFADKADGSIEVSVSKSLSRFTIRFHYWGLPFGYNVDRPKDECGEISLQLIRSLSSSYRMVQEGKAGQSIEIDIALPTGVDLVEEEPKPGEVTLATDSTAIRCVEPADMEALVQCLYSVFGYSYSAEDMYYPDAIRKKLDEGIYDGIVALNSKNTIVAHVGMLKESKDALICECGQAFVMPEYGQRHLFRTLKARLIEYADKQGMCGVFSSAVTGHPYTQRANIALGCVETGLELGYIPADLESVIRRAGDEQRQTVMNYFRTTSHNIACRLFIPAEHEAIIRRTYRELGMERDITAVKDTVLDDADSEINSSVKIVWNQVYLDIRRAGGNDFRQHIEGIMRRSLVTGCAVCYLSLPLTDPHTPAIVSALQQYGFFYAGIMPYEKAGQDAIRMQCLLSGGISPEYVIAVSDWGKELKEYVFEQKRKYGSY